MKTSTLIITIGFIVAVGMIATANIKLKQKFDRKEITSIDSVETLPAFKYIKLDLRDLETNPDTFNDEHNFLTRFKIVHSNISALKCNRFRRAYLNIKIINDTLFVLPTEEAIKIRYYWADDVYIFSPTLSYLSAHVEQAEVSSFSKQHLSVQANSISKILLLNNKIENLITHSKQSGRIEMNETNSIDTLTATVSHRSNLISRNLLFKEKHIVVDKTASLQLSGKSLEDFGVKTSNH